MSAFRGRCKTPPVMAALAGLAAFAAPIDSGRDDLRRRVDRGQRHVSSCWMPSRQENLEHSLRCLRALEVLMRHPKLSPDGKKRLGCALRMQKAGVRMRLKVMTASGESGVKRTAGRLPRPNWFPPSPHRAQKKRDVRTPGPDELREEFDRGFVYSQIDISSN